MAYLSLADLVGCSSVCVDLVCFSFDWIDLVGFSSDVVDLVGCSSVWVDFVGYSSVLVDSVGCSSVWVGTREYADQDSCLCRSLTANPVQRKKARTTKSIRYVQNSLWIDSFFIIMESWVMKVESLCRGSIM